MFWGQGDSSKLGDSEVETLRQLRRMVETGHIQALDPGEAAVALRAIDFYAKWEGAISVAGSIRNVFVLVAGGLVFWWATGGQNFISDWIQSLGTP